jgi:hypothetical protein
MAESKSADEDGYAGKQAVEEIERAHGTDAYKIKQSAFDPQVREGLVQALENPVSSPVVSVCLHRRPSPRKVERWWLQSWSDPRSDTPEPVEDIHGHYRDPGPGRYARESFFRARLSVGELVSTNHDGDQAGDFGDGSGEEVL